MNILGASYPPPPLLGSSPKALGDARGGGLLLSRGNRKCLARERFQTTAALKRGNGALAGDYIVESADSVIVGGRAREEG